MPSSPIKSTKAFKERQEILGSKKKFKDKFEAKSEESFNSMQVPPLEKLTVDLTNELSDSPDTNNPMDDDNDESAHSLTLSHKENKSPNDDNDSDSDSDSDESSDDDDDDDELYAGLSKEEKEKIKQTMGGIQNEFEQQQKIEREERIKQIKDTVAFNLSIDVSDEQALFIDEFVTENQYNLEQELQDEGVNFLEGLKEMMQQKALLNGNNDNDNDNDMNYNKDYDFESDDDEDWVQNEKKKKAKRAKKRKGIPKNTNLDGSKRCGRLLLNEALKNPQDQSKWSDARKKAWKNRKTAQNAYFYRFNVPGQPQKNGKWTKGEHELFMKRVLNFGVNDQWGVFSKAIPGRVGYQCSNYWRGLVKDGDVTDPNYFYDGKKLHFKRNTKQFSIKSQYRKYAITINRDISGIWKPLPKKHPKHPSDQYCQQVKQAYDNNNNRVSINNNNNKNNNKRKKRKRRNNNDDSDEEFEGPQHKKRIKTSDNDNNNNNNNNNNPLPDFKDIITGCNIIRPAISPYGHVLGYDTWTKILRTTKKKNMCPFTWQKMTRRSLIKLNKDNIDNYRSKIMNITDEQLKLMTEANK